MQISSLKEKLQRAKHEYESEAERAVSLEDQNILMRKNIEDLRQEIVNKEKEQVLNKKEVTETSSQTDNDFCEVRVLSTSIFHIFTFQIIIFQKWYTSGLTI